MMSGPSCRICQEPPGPKSPAFCAMHFREYVARQQRGVSTAELDARWLDTLATWHERPNTLAAEPNADSLMFRNVEDAWLLFMHGYSSRLPDWIVVNVHTGESRRFVEISGQDVVDDLNGVWAAPHQENLHARWGHPEPRETRAERLERYEDEQHRVSLSAVVRDAVMSVYGLAGRPLGLTLATFSWSHSSHGVLDLHFTFVSPTRATPSRVFAMGSTDQRYFRTVRSHSGGPAWGPLRLAVDQLLNEFHYRSDAWKTINVPPDEFADHDVVIDGTLFHGPLAFWSNPVEEAAFRFANESMVLQGCAFGLARRDLTDLLAHLVAVGNRPDLQATYSTELDRNRPT